MSPGDLSRRAWLLRRVVLAAAVATVAGCGSGIASPSTTQGGEPPPSRPGPSASTPTDSPQPTLDGSAGPPRSPAPSDAGAGVLTLCTNDPSTPPSDIDCKDAIEAALAAAALPSPPFRAELHWSTLCPPATPCPSRPLDPNVADVVLYLPDGTGVEVAVRLVNGGVVAGAANRLSQAEVGPRPAFVSPAISRADVGAAPALVADRPALPYCGSEDAGLAGPFSASGRQCFLGSVLAGEAAEFASQRSDVGGVPFVEIWRTSGSGPIQVLLDQDGHWSELTCALTLTTGDQLFDHTDCAVSPIT